MVRRNFTTPQQRSGKKSTSSGPQPDIHSAQRHLIDPHPLCYQPRPRCAATTRLLLATCQRRCAGEAQETLRHGENIMTVLLGYFLIAAIAGVATSATIAFVLTSLVIARIDKGRPSRIKYVITSFGGIL
jgi:hypothetical protein